MLSYAEKLEYLRLLEAQAHSNRFFDRLFKQQRKVVRSKSKRKVVRCSRRAGKTELVCDYLLKTCEDYPQMVCPYIALTRKSAKRLMWGRLKARVRELGVKADFSETDLVVRLSNESEIWLMGANNEDTAETLRGPAYKLVAFDECASFRGHIDTLIDEIVEPATADHDGTILLAGTPSWDFSSYFYRADHNAEWESFHWTLLENPHMPRAEEWLERLKRSRRWSDDNPIFLREYKGQWSKSEGDMVYLFNPLVNLVETAPQCEFYYLGVDLGFDDETAFSVVGHNRNVRRSYVVHTEKHSGWKPHQIAERIAALDSQYDFFKMVCDEGGLGKMVAEEFRSRYGIPIRAAQKTEKRSYIEFMNAEFKDGRILVVEGQPVIAEWNQLIWDNKKKSDSPDGPVMKKVEAPGTPNHCADATLYAWRESLAYLEEALKPPTKPGSQEWYDEQERAIIAQRTRALRQKEESSLL